MIKDSQRVIRLRRLVDESGGPSAFAKKYSQNADNPIDETYVSQILNGHRSFGEKAARNMEHRAGLTHEYFDVKDSNSNVEPGPVISGRVPLISWVQALMAWAQAGETAYMGDVEGLEQIPMTVQKGRHTFALEVVGDAMSPDFPPGMRLIVEPDMKHQSGDYVIVQSGGQATFKQLVKDGADWYLKPINPQYPTKSLGDARIVGVVREVMRKLR